MKYRSLAELEELEATKKKAYLRFLDMVEPREQLVEQDAARKAGKAAPTVAKKKELGAALSE